MIKDLNLRRIGQAAMCKDTADVERTLKTAMSGSGNYANPGNNS